MKKSLDQLRLRVQDAIRNEEEFVLDLCADLGQIFDNVKYMTWFHNAVAEHLVCEYSKTWGHLAQEDRNYMYVDRRYYGTGKYTRKPDPE